jgi:hypothetical protein
MMDAFQNRPDKTAVALAVGTSAIALLIAPGAMLLVAMSMFAAALLVRHRLQGLQGA